MDDRNHGLRIYSEPDDAPPRRLSRCGVLCAFGLVITSVVAVTLTVVDAIEARSSSPAVNGREWLPTEDAREMAAGWWLSYDGRTRTARWVLEVLTPDRFEQDAGVARHGGFHTDHRTPPECRAVDRDYAGSGYDRGHLAPSANWRRSAEEQASTFSLANVAPQNAECNRGLWRSIEADVRSLACANTVISITAPLYLPSDGVVTIPVIGDGQVWVPTHFGKAVLFRAGPRAPWRVRCWIVPNADPEESTPDDYVVTVDTFESAAGLDLWAALPDHTESALESVIDAGSPLLPVPAGKD